MTEYVPPDLYCPIPAAVHPRLAQIERQVIDWLDAHRLYHDDADRAWGIATGSSEFSARVLPDGDDDAVALFACWNHLAFALDDWHDAGSTTSTADVVDLNWRIIHALEVPDATPLLDSRFAPALRDLAARTHAIATSTAQYRRFTEAVRDWLFGAAWATAHTERRTLPTVDNYVGMRASINGIRFSVWWIEVAHHLEVSTAEWTSPKVQALTAMAGWLGGVDNDLLGYTKDADLDVTEPNLVNVIAAEHNCDLPHARRRAVTLRDQVMDRFLTQRQQVIANASPALHRYLTGLGHYVRGVLDWTNTAPRYASPRNHHPLPVPTATLGITIPPAPTSPPPTTAPDLPSISWWWHP